MTDAHLTAIHDRHDMISYFDGQSAANIEATPAQRAKHPLLKSFLIEVLGDHIGSDDEFLPQVFQRQGVSLEFVESGLFRVIDPNLGVLGFVERLRPRVVVLYSDLRVDRLRPWVKNLVYGSPELDNVWLSGLTFSVLWNNVVRLTKPDRFTRLVFTHDSIFQMTDDEEMDAETEPEETSPEGPQDEQEGIVERRATSFRLVDRVGEINSKLAQMQGLYSPLHAISQLRFPSPVGPGGHDFYDNGQVTNRSPSFRDHRAHLLFVVQIYERLLNQTEERAWYTINESVQVPGTFNQIAGAPVTIRFQDPGLDPSVFDEWVHATFERKRNKFRLWGNPLRLGPTKIHVYGVDRHLWRPIWMELTEKGCTAIIPKGTCGNTIHRLVTNIQRYLDPGIKAFIGDLSYEHYVEDSARSVSYDPRRE